MSSETETIESLWSYCIANKRLVPMPQLWNQLYGLLKNTRQKPTGGWVPPLPLILAAWNTTIPIDKQLRFKEHLQWAQENGQLDQIGKFLRALREEEWCHFGEV